MKFFVIGDEDTVLGFRYAGVDGRVARNGAEARRALDAASSDSELGAIVITERVANMARDAVDAMRSGRAVPVLVEIPDRDGPLPDKKTLADLIREAVGIRI